MTRGIESGVRALMLALVVLVVSPGCLFRAARGAPPVAGELRIEGNRAVETETILSRLSVEGSGRWFFGLTGAHPFEPEALPGDAKRIERIYQSLGFYGAKVEDVRVKVQGGRADVTFVVNEGPATLVTTLAVAGMEALPTELQKHVLGDLPLKQGERLVEEQYDRTKLALRERLRSHGHMNARVSGKVTVDRTRTGAEVLLDVVPGDPLRIGRVFVAGAQGVSKDRITLMSELEAGQLITPDRLAEAQRQIYGMGVFTLVQVEPAAPERPGMAPVVITVHEAPFISRELGLGIVTDPYRWVGQVRGQWQHKNLARGLQQLTVGAALGYAVLPGVPQWLFGDGATSHGVVADGRVEYLQPRVLRSFFDVSTGADYSKEITNAFAYQRTGLKLGFPAHLDRWLPGTTFTTSFNYDFYFQVNQSGEIPVGTTGSFTTSGCGAPAGTSAQDERCFIGYVEGRLTIDRRDDPIATHKGFFVLASAQYAGLPFSDFNYVRLAPEMRGYVPLTARTTLAARVRWGMLFKTSSGGRDLPGVSKFFSGGANSVRVAGAQQLGPRDALVERNPDFGGNDVDCSTGQTPCKDRWRAGPPLPLGGNRLLEGSLELRMPTRWENLGWVLFADVGAVAAVDDTSLTLLPTSEHLLYGVGVGLRYRTPVGPIRLDFAQRLRSWNERPVNVRLAPGTPTPPSLDPAAYAFSTGCRAAGYPTSSSGATWHQCYEEGGYLWGFQFFLTIGEAF